jgi:putative two-component system response regulator
VGKVGIPDAILKKPGKLTTEEMDQMKQHTIFGYNLLREAKADPVACQIALRHHEKWNGSGYPDGLEGEHIPTEARIVAVADVFDAVTTKRCYKEAWSNEDALSFLHEQSGAHFDPRLIQLFTHQIDQIRAIQEEFGDGTDQDP